MVVYILKKNLSQKLDQNIHQNAPDCTIFNFFPRGGIPPNPPSKAHGFATCKFPNLKKILGPPPPNAGDAPDIYILLKYVFRSLYH